MYKIFHVSRRWLSVEKQEDAQLNDLIGELFTQSQKAYGTRRIKKNLEQSYGIVVSRSCYRPVLKNGARMVYGQTYENLACQ